MPFSHIEKCNMLETYLMCRKDSTRALQEYRQKYPDSDLPDRRYFLVLYRKFRSNETVFGKTRKRKEFIIDENVEINILAYFEAHKDDSVRDLARNYGTSLTTICRVLRKHKYVPYKYRPTQTLIPTDTERRLSFCRWLCNKYIENNGILKNILWSDEANFSNKGMFNPKNMHYWSKENLFLTTPRNPQNKFSTNVWCGLIGSKIIGPVFYQGTLTGRRYLELVIFGVLEDFLDNLDLASRQVIYFQQDGAPPHQLNEVAVRLEEMFQGRWIATNGPIPWPPRSPDITPLDFYFWGFIKNEVYKQNYANEEDLRNNIIRIIDSIDGRTILRATQRVLKCARKCVEQNGGVFAHLL